MNDKKFKYFLYLELRSINKKYRTYLKTKTVLKF